MPRSLDRTVNPCERRHHEPDPDRRFRPPAPRGDRPAQPAGGPVGAAVLMASAATLHAEMPDFNEPQDWTIHSKPGNPAGQDPLNVILSAQSDVSLEEVFAAMDGTVPAGYKLFCQAGGGESGSCDYVPVYWKPVAVVEATDQAGKVAAFFNGGCISPMFGQVQPTGAPKEQDLSYRAGGFDTCAQYDPPINHLRRYIQTIPGNNNQTAAFLAVSLEQACLLHEGAVVYHCIAPDGFNQGRRLSLRISRTWPT